MFSQALVVLLLCGSASGFSTDFENTLASRIRTYHDAYMRQNFDTRHVATIRVLRSAKGTHDISKNAATSGDVATGLNRMIGNPPDEIDTLNPDEVQAEQFKTYPLRMMIGNSPDSGEFDHIPDKNVNSGPLQMMIRNSPHPEEFKRQVDSQNKPLRMMVGNSPDSGEFDEIDTAIPDVKPEQLKTYPLRMMIGNSPYSGEFDKIDTTNPDDEFKRQIDTQNKPLRMMIGNSPDSGEFDEIDSAIPDVQPEQLKTYPLRMMIGNSPDSGEFDETDTTNPDEFKRQIDTQNKPLRMMIGNSPDSGEFDESDSANPDFQPEQHKTYPLRMMIGNSPDSGEFDEIDTTNPDEFKRQIDTQNKPLRMMIGNSPDSGEFDEIDSAIPDVQPEQLKTYPLRMMIGNSPYSGEFDETDTTNPDEFKRQIDTQNKPLRMMIGNSPDSGEFDEGDSAIPDVQPEQLKTYPLRMMIGNSPDSGEFDETDTTNPDELKRQVDTQNKPQRMMIRNSPNSKTLVEHGDRVASDQAMFISPPHAANILCEKSNSCDDTVKWNTFLDSIDKDVNGDLEAYYHQWNQLPILLTDELRQQFRDVFPAMSLKSAIQSISQTNALMRLFWPFSFDVSLMNQKLALYGISGEVHEEKIKTLFFQELNGLQGIDMPVAENKVILSFNHPRLVDGMNRSSLLQNGHDFVSNGKHLFNETEATEIRSKVKAAFNLIKRVSPSLYKSIKQLISCIAFYKAQDQIHLGGSVSSALGVIWLDPSTNYNWSVPFYAEQIVHEFTHNALFYEELVHGTYTDHSKFSQAKVISAIRRQLRDYDKSFHAAYVSTGLIAFHSKAGYQKRAFNLARPLPSSVRDLVKVNQRTRILTNNGEAMLQTLVDFLTLARIQDENGQL